MSEPRQQRGAKQRRASLLTAMLLLCLAIKAMFMGVSFYQGMERLPWPSPAEAADGEEASTIEGDSGTELDSPLTELLEKKELQLREKEETLREEEEKLRLLKQEISTKLAELAAIEQKVSQELKQIKAREKAMQNGRLKHLAEVYKGMEPTKAAKLMEKLEEPIAVQIIRRMRGRAAGQILSNIEPNKAARISKRLSRSDKNLPPSSSDQQPSPDQELQSSKRQVAGPILAASHSIEPFPIYT